MRPTSASSMPSRPTPVLPAGLRRRRLVLAVVPLDGARAGAGRGCARAACRRRLRRVRLRRSAPVHPEVDAAFEELFAVRRAARAQPGEEPGAVRWPKEGHLERIRESGRFRFSRELLCHSFDRDRRTLVSSASPQSLGGPLEDASEVGESDAVVSGRSPARSSATARGRWSSATAPAWASSSGAESFESSTLARTGAPCAPCAVRPSCARPPARRASGSPRA